MDGDYLYEGGSMKAVYQICVMLIPSYTPDIIYEGHSHKECLNKLEALRRAYPREEYFWRKVGKEEN